MPSPIQLQNRPEDQGKVLVEINLAVEVEEAQPAFLGTNISTELIKASAPHSFEEIQRCLCADLDPHLIIRKLTSRKEQILANRP